MMRLCPWSVPNFSLIVFLFALFKIMVAKFIEGFYFIYLQEERRMSLAKYQMHDENSQVSHNNLSST